MTSHESAPTVSDLALAIEAYTSSQRELLECVRKLRAEIRAALEPGALLEGDTPPFTQGSEASVAHLRTNPLWPVSAYPSQHEACPPPNLSGGASSGPTVGTATTPEASRRQALDANGAQVTKRPSRDYDYFAELDAKLALLEAQLSQDPLGPRNQISE